MLEMNWFKIDFDKFYEDKAIGYSPSLGISYRLRNPQHVWEDKISPTTYDLASQEGFSHDLDFIRGLYKNLEKTSESGTTEEIKFRLKLATIPLNPLNLLGTFLYVYIGMTKSFCEKAKNPKRATSFINKMGTSAILWGLKNGKRPIELGFNYDFCDSQKDYSKNLKGHNLDEFLKLISEEDN